MRPSSVEPAFNGVPDEGCARLDGQPGAQLPEQPFLLALVVMLDEVLEGTLVIQ